MDTTALQNQIDTLNTTIATDETTLAADQAELVKLEAEMKVASLVNQLEALTSEEITALNALLAEPENTLGVSLVVAAAPANEPA